MKNIKKIIFGICLCLFIMMACLVSLRLTGSFDSLVYSIIPKNDTLSTIMKIVTLIGEDITIIGLSILILIFVKNKKQAVSIPGSALCISIINTILKFIFRRPRPAGIALIHEGGYSFPSGHSITALVFYGFIIYLITKSELSTNKKVFICSSIAIIIFLIGISRIYLGVHYASDVLGGFLLGGAFLTIYIEIYNKLSNK